MRPSLVTRILTLACGCRLVCHAPEGALVDWESLERERCPSCAEVLQSALALVAEAS